VPGLQFQPGLQDVIFFGWRIVCTNMRYRLGRKRQAVGNAGSNGMYAWSLNKLLCFSNTFSLYFCIFIRKWKIILFALKRKKWSKMFTLFLRYVDVFFALKFSFWCKVKRENEIFSYSAFVCFAKTKDFLHYNFFSYPMWNRK